MALEEYDGMNNLSLKFNLFDSLIKSRNWIKFPMSSSGRKNAVSCVSLLSLQTLSVEALALKSKFC